MKELLETTNYHFFEGKIEYLTPGYFKRRKPREKCGEVLNQLETLTTCEFELLAAYKMEKEGD